jgi:hypothetical protein
MSSRFYLCLLLAASAGATRADEVTNWNRVATSAAAAGGQNGIVQTRTYAIVHIAMHDALNAVEQRHRPYLLEVRPTGPASAAAALASAAHATLVELVPTQRAAIDSAYETALAALPDDPAKSNGTAVGRAAAAAILARRSNDGFAATAAWTAGVLPGYYRETPPANAPAFLPHWGQVLPFTLRSSDQFRTEPPPDLFSARYAAEVNEVILVGGAQSMLRTDQQSEIARYWYEPSAQAWNRIARNVAAGRNFELWRNARLFALLNVAMAEGYIAGFESKYYYNFWRPITAIREAHADGNPETQGDAGWNSYLVTPPVPDWPSTHSVAGAAAAAVLAGVSGTDMITFEMTNGPPYEGVTRRFYSFSEAALENAHSRVLAGIHFRAACAAGLEQGRRIGEYALENYFQPIR